MFHAEVSTPRTNHIFCSSSVFSSNPQNLLPSSDPIFVPLEELIDYTSFADDYPELYEVQSSISRATSTSEEEKQVAQSTSNNTVATTLECDGESAFSCESPFDFDSIEEASLSPSVSEIPSTPESAISSPASPIPAVVVPTPTNLMPVPCYTSYQLCSGPLAKLDFGKPIAFTLHPAIPIPVSSSTSAQISEARTVIGNGNNGAAAINLPLTNFKKPRARGQARNVILKSDEKSDSFVARPRQKQIRKSIVANQRRRDDKGKFIKESKKLSVKNIESAMVM